MILLDYQTLKQKYDDYQDKKQLLEKLLDEYETKTHDKKGNRLSCITILDDIEELQLELNTLQDELFKHLVESNLFELFKKEIMKE